MALSSRRSTASRRPDTGPRAARSGIGRRLERLQERGWIEQGVRHIYTNHVITPTADGATGVVDMLMIGLGGDPNKIEYDGYYEDTYVRTPQGWRFKQRVHHALLRAGQRTPPAAGGELTLSASYSRPQSSSISVP